MQILRTLIVAATAIAAATNGTRTGPMLASSAPSGHTIVVPGAGHVLLLGIQAPSPGTGPVGDPIGIAARERLNGLVAHRFVILEYPHVLRAGVIPRGAAYVFLEDGTFVNRLLVREGLARVSGVRSAPRAAELQQAEDAARNEKRGLWGR